MAKELKPIDVNKYIITETGQVLKRINDETAEEIKDKDEFDPDLGDNVQAVSGYKVITGIITGIDYGPRGTLYFVAGEWYIAGELKKL